MRKIILITGILSSILIYSCVSTKDGFTKDGYRNNVLKTKIEGRNYLLMITKDYQDVLKRDSPNYWRWGYGYPLHVKGDTLFSSVYVDSKLLKNIHAMDFRGKILDYQQKDLPRGQIEVTFSIEVIDSIRNEDSDKTKFELPTSYRLVFGPWDIVQIYIDKLYYSGEFSTIPDPIHGTR